MTTEKVWVKACGTSSCVQVCFHGEQLVLIRNSDDPDEWTMHTRSEFKAFTDAVKNGEFDGGQG